MDRLHACRNELEGLDKLVVVALEELNVERLLKLVLGTDSQMDNSRYRLSLAGLDR